MNGMFKDCYSLEEPDISYLDTSNVLNISYMFASCKKFKNLNLKYFDTLNIIDMSYLFYFSDQLISLDISKFENGPRNNNKNYVYKTHFYLLIYDQIIIYLFI